MKKFFLITGIGIALLAILFVGYLFTSNFWDNRNPLMKAHMWEVTRAWTGVPELPEDATGFRIKTNGGSLTRKFESAFAASNSSIETWLSGIPDFDKTEQSELPGGSVEHVGAGRKGATYYRLKLNPGRTEVRLFVSWN